MSQVRANLYSGNLILPLADGMSVRKIYRHEQRFITERHALHALEPLELPVPRILGEGRDGARRYLDMTRLPGIRCQPPGRGQRSAEERLRCYALGRLVRRLHESTKGQFLGDEVLPRRTLESLFDALRQLEAELDIEPVAGYLERNQPIIECPGTDMVLLHRDLRFDNLLWDSSCSRLGLVDFEVCAVGAGAGDLARILLLELGEDGRCRDAFLEGYGNFHEADERVFEVAFAVEMLCWVQKRGQALPEEQQLAQRLKDLLEAVKWMGPRV